MLTQEKLKEFVSYDPETGCITWNHRENLRGRQKAFNVVFAGKDAGTINKLGYIQITIDKKIYYAHRIIWFYAYGYMPNNHIDHINGIRTDNRIDNLREANKSENGQNRSKQNKNNKSGFLGVSFDKQFKKYVSKICINGEGRRIGFFNTPEDAHQAYIKAKRELHPFGTL